MSIVDWIYACLIYVWSELDKASLGAGITAFIVAVLRMRKYGKVVWGEALLCGVFASIAITGATFVIMVLGIPADGWVNSLATGGANVVAGFIGWYGTDKTINFAESKFKGEQREEVNSTSD